MLSFVLRQQSRHLEKPAIVLVVLLVNRVLKRMHRDPLNVQMAPIIRVFVIRGVL